MQSVLNSKHSNKFVQTLYYYHILLKLTVKGYVIAFNEH